jgi:tripeptide aminopeptidase
MDTNTFESLKKVIGDDIIVTDGNTLLGADDKAGVSEIMELCAYYVTNPKVPHVNIYICFTPDEEIGNGTLHIDLNKFKPDFAYTVDGGDVSCIEYETFNAASATVEIFGKSVHPGYAKNKMVNASLVLYEFHALLPKKMQPQFTENYEGFNHLTSVNGSCEYAKSTYIIRNHDKEKFNAQKELFPQVAATLNAKYGYEIAKVTIKDQYYNMGDVIKDRMETIEIPKQACKNIGLEPYTEPIRGGTDGSKLTYMGIICPNLGGGGFNFHGRYEFCSINQMEKALLLLKEIVHLVSVEN